MVGTIKVVNKYKVPNHWYCGRGSVLGNPFPMKGEHQRDQVCDDYRDMFITKVNNKDTAFITELTNMYMHIMDGNDLNLGCFCAPRRCHCDTIKGYLEYWVAQTQ